MNKLASITAVLLISHLVVAEDLSFSFEGNAQKRVRLATLQGSKELPALSLSNWENSSEFSLADLKGKIVVLSFWATWCGPCIRRIPLNNELHEKYQKDVVFIGICHPKGAEKMRDLIQEKSIKYPIAVDKHGETIEAYKVDGYPDYFIIDRDGTLAVADCANDKVEAVLEKLLQKQTR